MSVRIAIAVVALLGSSSAFAGGYYGGNSGNNQIANSSAYNLSAQFAKVSAGRTKDITQATGASADSYNKSKCGCAGKQTANAEAKNVSLQVAVVSAHRTGDITQTSGASASATNIKGR